MGLNGPVVKEWMVLENRAVLCDGRSRECWAVAWSYLYRLEIESMSTTHSLDTESICDAARNIAVVLE